MRPERIEPGPGQESVWDYPRPPAVRPSDEHVRVVHHGVVVADTRRAIRVCETSQPPAYYIPREDVAAGVLQRSSGHSWCEWKGAATYWDLVVPGPDGGRTVVSGACWSYETPSPAFTTIAGHVAFYPQKVDGCWVDDERVVPNPGDFYGGWITSRVVGPFKGAPGTRHW